MTFLMKLDKLFKTDNTVDLCIAKQKELQKIKESEEIKIPNTNCNSYHNASSEFSKANPLCRNCNNSYLESIDRHNCILTCYIFQEKCSNIATNRCEHHDPIV